MKSYKEAEDKIFNYLQTQDKKSPTYLKSLLSFSSVLEKLFPKEFDDKMMLLGVKELMSESYATAGEMIKKSDTYYLNPYKRTIEVNLGDEKIESPIIELQDFMKSVLKLKEDTVDYLLVLSYLSRIENFELFQITQAIILK